MKKLLLAAGVLLAGMCVNLNAGHLEDLTKACNAGNASECTNLGLLYAEREDFWNAKESYTKSCAMGHSFGCSNLGMLYAEGLGVKKNPFKGVKMFKKGCDGGDGYGCYFLGVMYLEGKGVKPSASMAEDSFRKACDGGYYMGCMSLDTNTKHKKPVVKNEVIGIVYGLDPNGDGFLSIRKKPNSKEIGRLYNGDRVEILGRSGKWYKIRNIKSRQVGWSHSNWIRVN